MRTFAPAAFVVAVLMTVSACASSSSSSAQLPKSLRTFAQSFLTDRPNRHDVTEVDVYGPGSRAALNEAASGDIVTENSREKHMRFYLLVIYGKFQMPSGPLGGKPRGARIATSIWSPQEGETDDGVGNSPPAAMSSLHRLAVVKP